VDHGQTRAPLTHHHAAESRQLSFSYPCGPERARPWCMRAGMARDYSYRPNGIWRRLGSTFSAALPLCLRSVTLEVMAPSEMVLRGTLTYPTACHIEWWPRGQAGAVSRSHTSAASMSRRVYHFPVKTRLSPLGDAPSSAVNCLSGCDKFRFSVKRWLFPGRALSLRW